MTVEIRRKELLRQLPQMAGYALIQWLDEMPDRFIFEALPVKTKEEELNEAHPELPRLLTPKEYALFLALYRRGKVTHTTLLADLGLYDEESFTPNSNTLSVHIKALRKKLNEHTRFRIITFRAGFNRQGRYALREL